MKTYQLERRGPNPHGGAALMVVFCMLMAFVTPFTPFFVGALEIALFDKELAVEWVGSTGGVVETIAAFYRALGMPC